MKPLLRNILLVLGLGAGLQSGAGATTPVHSSGGYFVDLSVPVSDWTDAAAQAAFYSTFATGNFASIRTQQENAAVFSLINTIMAADPTTVGARFYIGLQFSGGLWTWVSGDPTFTNNLYVPGPTPSTVSIPWAGVDPYGPPLANNFTAAGAYIFCSSVNNSTVSSPACSSLGWDYDDSSAQVSGYFVMRDVPAPATLGLMLVGLAGVAGIRRNRS